MNFYWKDFWKGFGKVMLSFVDNYGKRLPFYAFLVSFIAVALSLITCGSFSSACLDEAGNVFFRGLVLGLVALAVIDTVVESDVWKEHVRKINMRKSK